MWQESSPQAASLQQKTHQNDPKEMSPKQVENTEEQTKCPPNVNGKHLLIEIPKDDRRNVSPMTGERGTFTLLDSSRNTLSSSGCDNTSNQINNPTEPSNTFQGVLENPSTEGLCHLSHRETALNKFRLKRKDRCFEKKVGSLLIFKVLFQSISWYHLLQLVTYTIAFIFRFATRAGNYWRSSVHGLRVSLFVRTTAFREVRGTRYIVLRVF
jgi:hypothetical protein